MAGQIGKTVNIKGNIKIKVYFLAGILLIIILQIRHINELYGPWVNDDEIGYWGTAAFFAGYNWSGVLKYSAYYSYGYGILIAPLFLIFKNPTTLYRSAVCLNIIFLLLVFLIAYIIVRQIYNELEKEISILIALIATLTSGAVTYAEIAWSETAILLFTWLTLFLFWEYLKRRNLLFLVLFTLCNLGIYIIHQRMLGIVIASSIILIFCVLYKKIPANHILLYITLLIVGIVIASVLKTYIQDVLWNYGESSSLISNLNVNDYEGQIGKIALIFSSPNNFLLFIENVLGKIFYFNFASFFTLFICLYFFFKKIIKKQISNEVIFYLFALLSIAGMIAITSIFNFNPGRNDGLIYGRYSESLVGITILIGFANCLCSREKKIVSIPILIFLFSPFLEVLLAYMVKHLMWIGENAVFTLNIPAMSRYIVLEEQTFYIAKFLIESIAILCVILFIIYFYQKNTKLRNIVLSALFIILLFTSYANETCVYREHISFWQAQKKEVISLIQRSENIISNRENIYFLMQDEFNLDGNRNIIQYTLRDKEIECISEDLLPEMKEGDLIFINISNPLYEDVKDQFILVKENSVLGLFISD